MDRAPTDTVKQPQAAGTPVPSAHRQTQVTQQARPATAGSVSAARGKLNWRRWLVAVVAILGVLVGGCWLTPLVGRGLSAISWHDAYVNGDVTFVAPGVA